MFSSALIKNFHVPIWVNEKPIATSIVNVSKQVKKVTTKETNEDHYYSWCHSEKMIRDD